jgi:two-component system, response regulator, stage 0 sporulation protein F
MNPAILLVDDESAILAILRRLIRDLAPNYDLVTVSDGAAALATIAQRPVVLVMTDQLMPDMDGVSLAVAIKAVAPQCPVILMTGYATSEIQQRAKAAGVDYFLAKPFPFDQLVSTVRAALRR